MEVAFDAYFRTADLDRDGRISGQEVVAFFKGSGLPQPVLAQEHERRLERIRNKGIEGSHIWPFQVWLQTDKAAYLLRQYFFNNLHDRISTRPFLSLIAKKWLAFQISSYGTLIEGFSMCRTINYLMLKR